LMQKQITNAKKEKNMLEDQDILHKALIDEVEGMFFGGR